MKQHNEVPYKIYLSEDELPKAWYNVRADMKNKPFVRPWKRAAGGGSAVMDAKGNGFARAS